MIKDVWYGIENNKSESKDDNTHSDSKNRIESFEIFNIDKSLLSA